MARPSSLCSTPSVALVAVAVSVGALADASGATVLAARGSERVRALASRRQAVASLLACLSISARKLHRPPHSNAVAAVEAGEPAAVTCRGHGRDDELTVRAPVRRNLTNLPPPVAPH